MYQKFSVLLLLTILFACNKKQATEEVSTKAADNPPAQAVTFSLESVPVSDYKITNAKFIELPDGYRYDRPNGTNDDDKLGFFTDENSYVMKQGPIFQSRISPVQGREFSLSDIIGSIEKFVDDAGGQKIFEGKVTQAAVERLDREVGGKYMYDAYGFIGYAKTYTYLIRNADQENWIQVNESDDRMSVYMGVVLSK